MGCCTAKIIAAAASATVPIVKQFLLSMIPLPRI
jgi:hypothetical protein